MYILTKSMLALMIGFILSTLFGLILIPLLKKFKIGQKISSYVGKTHQKKEGIPTMGGLIFIIPTFVTIIILDIFNKITINANLLIILFVFVSYAVMGFIDDYLKIKRSKNEGLTELQKLFGQVIIALVFYAIFIKSGLKPILWISLLGIKVNLGLLYPLFILFILVGSANAVNITDGLDGLAGGLSCIAALFLGIIAWATTWLLGYQDIAMFCFILSGSILGFLVYNSHPARVIMGDTGSLAIGGVLASVAILIGKEITFAVIMFVFILETLSVIIQTISLVIFKKKVFLMTPLHHHFEKLGWNENDIVKLFWVVGFISGAAAIVYGAWI